MSISYAQGPTTVVDSNATSRVVIAGSYDRSGLHNFLFGKHYRKEWATPVKAPVILLDTAAGGLHPYEAGGGRQSKSLKLRDNQNREYVLRSLDKSFGRALPPVFLGTFIEDLVDDQVTIGHPYSAFTIAPMAEAAGILHTNPVMGYVPRQPALDSFNERFGNLLYMLEQRPDENWETAANFANSKKITSTDKMLEKTLEDNTYQVDQLLYVRSRLFDMLIGDWGRHEDQWRWALVEEGDKKIYKAIPRDRDQAYTKFDGLLPKLVLHAANLDHLQSFDDDIKAINAYSFTTRHLDRRFANEVTLDQWVAIAKELQQSLTDGVIENAVRQMPPEVFPLSGPGIISHLKSRRDKLEDFARKYYAFLSRHADIPGSNEREYFDVRRVNDDGTQVDIYSIGKDGSKAEKPFYSRLFKTDETEDVRLYGVKGNDVYHVSGDVNDGISLKLIGGSDKDSIVDESHVKGMAKKTKIYDGGDNIIVRSGETKVHYANDSASHAYNYEEYDFHKKGMKLMVSYNNPDRVYVGIGYGFKRHMWRKYPYGFDQTVSLRYSISQNAFSIWYEGIFYQAVGKWNLGVAANYDAIRWTNFAGLGNETKKPNITTDYYQLRTNEFNGGLSLNRTFNDRHNIDLTTFYQAVEIVNDSGRYVTETYSPKQLFDFDHNQYVGATLGYSFQDVNDHGLPTKGAMFYVGGGYTLNLRETDKGFTRFNSILQLYVPLFWKFSLSLRGSIANVHGEPEFFQYASIGGSQTMRGYKRDRFWGETAFYNSNELRWITDFRTYLMNGKFGLVGFVDDGRVWMPKENSDVIHLGYGGGIVLAPFNKFSVSLTYGISEESKLVHVRVNKSLFK